MINYVMVPVPEELVTDVMRFITVRTAADAPLGDDVVDESAGADLPSVPWTTDDLRKLHNTQTATTRTVSAILTELAKCAPDPMSTSALEAATGINRNKIRGSLAALTRHIKKHYRRTNWPMIFQWSTELDPTLPAEAFYHLGRGTADAWRAVTSE